MTGFPKQQGRGRPLQPPSQLRLALTVLRHELRTLLRDRRALFVGFVLPIVLYPFLFLISERLGRLSEERIDARTLQVSHDLSEAPLALRMRILEALGDTVATRIELRSVAVSEAPDANWVREVLGKDSDAYLLAVAPRGPDAEAGAPLQLEIHGDFAREDGAAARQRLRAALEPLQRDQAIELRSRLLGGDPGQPFEETVVDMASAEDRAGLGLGRLLPLIAILVLVSGGSFAALDAFAGERERGTLETLLVHPVPAAAIAWGKYAAVLLAAGTALFGNIFSLVACVGLELGTLPGVDPAEGSNLPGVGRLLFGALLFVPVAALVSAALAYVCARARSYREGQHYVTPLTLVALIPGAMAAAPEVELDAFTALLPVAGPALAMREALRGALSPGAFAGVFAISVAWVAFALRGLARTLDAERLLAGADAEGADGGRRGSARMAVRWGFVAVFALYLIGSELQAANPLGGLMLTLWVIVPALALLAARGTARRTGEPLHHVLGLRPPQALHVLGAFWLAPGIAFVARHLIEWQSRVLPLPSMGGGVARTPAELFGTDHAGLLLFALALSPAITEELLFRGALLSGLRADLKPSRCIAWQALLFALAHLSVHRLLATALMGALLAAITLRARSILPAIVLHGTYNALLVATALELPAAEGLLASPWLLLSPLGFVLLATSASRSTRTTAVE